MSSTPGECLDVDINCRQNLDCLKVRRLARYVLPTRCDIHVGFVSDVHLNYRIIQLAQNLTLFSMRLADNNISLENKVHREAVITGAITLTEATPL